MANQETASRILDTFINLLASRGIEATTTRLLAGEAGVNEVTIFRHFGDKSNLIRQAFRRLDPAGRIAAFPLDFELGSAGEAAEGVLGVMQFLYRGLQEHPAAWQFSLGEYQRYPELRAELAAAPQAARGLLEKALKRAGPWLRPGIVPELAAMNLLGSIFTTVVWQSRGWLELDPGEVTELFLGSLRSVINWPETQSI